MLVTLLLQEMLLTFGTELIAFFSDGLSSCQFFLQGSKRSEEKVCILVDSD